MSKENLARFMSKVADSEELQAKIGEEIDAEALIALGAECGCEFSAEDLPEAAELSDDELDSIAGGFQVDVSQGFYRLAIHHGNYSVLEFKVPRTRVSAHSISHEDVFTVPGNG